MLFQNKFLLLKLLATLFLLNKSLNGQETFVPLVPSESYTHSLIVDEDNPEQFRLFWKLKNDEEIQIEAHCKTTGWMGIGLSPNGGMPGSDIAIGWIKRASNDVFPYLRDCNVASKYASAPKVDEKQDWILISGGQTNDYTILKFKRKFNTCDQNDREIKTGTVHMIFAWGVDLPDENLNNWKYHGNNRISRTIILRDFKAESIEEQNNLPSNLRSYDMRMNNLKIPKQNTYYYCQVFEVPSVSQKEHLIEFEMLVNPKNKKNVHHLLVYQCEDNYEPKDFQAQECGDVSLPYDVASNCMTKLIIAWGIGGQYRYQFPKEAGLPFYPSNKKKYVLVEMHYDNPNLETDRIDDSGVRLLFTPTLRPHDLGMLTLGVDGSKLSLQIPPDSSSITFTGTCFPACTKKFLPKEGVYAVASLLHTHLIGKSVTTKLVRNGEVIQNLFENPSYDFNYQFIMDIKPTKIYPNDVLITECSYNSKERKNFTYFGFSTADEMCFSFVYYYPSQPYFSTCLSVTPLNLQYDFYKSLVRESLIPEFPFKSIQYSNMNEIINFFNTKVTPSAKLTQRFEEFFQSDYDRSLFCGAPMSINESMYEENVKNYKPTKELVEHNSCDDSSTSSAKSSIIVSSKDSTKQITTSAREVITTRYFTTKHSNIFDLIFANRGNQLYGIMSNNKVLFSFFSFFLLLLI